MRSVGLVLGAAALTLAEREGAVRLVDPSDPELKDTIPWGRKWWMGRAFPQIYWKGEWGAICGGSSVDVSTMQAMGTLLCGQAAGKPFKRIKQLPLEFFPMVTGGAGRIWMDAYQCPVGVKCLGECIHALDMGAYSCGCRAIAVECGEGPAVWNPPAPVEGGKGQQVQFGGEGQQQEVKQGAAGGGACGVARAKCCPTVRATTCPAFSALGSCLDSPTSPPDANKCKASKLDTVACAGLTVGKCYKTSGGQCSRAPLYCESTIGCERMGYGELNAAGCKRAASYGTDRCAGGTFDDLTGQEVMRFMDNGILPTIGCARMPNDAFYQKDISTPIMTGVGGTMHSPTTDQANLVAGLAVAGFGAPWSGNLGTNQANRGVTGNNWKGQLGDVPAWYVHCAANDLFWFTDPKGRGRPCGGTRAMCICSCNKYDEKSASPGCDEDGKLRTRNLDHVLQICHDGKWGHVCGTGIFVDHGSTGVNGLNRVNGGGFTPSVTAAGGVFAEPQSALSRLGRGTLRTSPTMPADHAVPIANIACAQAYGLAPLQITHAGPAPHGDKIWLDNLRCPSDGSARFLSDCLWGSGWGEVSPHCAVVKLICNDMGGTVPRPAGKPAILKNPKVCPRIFALSHGGRIGAHNKAPDFDPWNVFTQRPSGPLPGGQQWGPDSLTKKGAAAAAAGTPSLSPTRSPAKTVGDFGKVKRTYSPTEFPTLGNPTAAPTIGASRLRVVDPQGWSRETGCPLVPASDDPPNCLDRAATMGATCKSVQAECGTKAGYCYRVGPSPADGARFCEASAPCEQAGYSPIETEAECEAAMFTGTNRCFSGSGTFRSGLEVLGGIWAAANEWTGSTMFAAGGVVADGHDNMGIAGNAQGPAGRSHVMTARRNMRDPTNPNIQPLDLAEDGKGTGPFNQGTFNGDQPAVWGLGLYPTGCFRVMGEHTFGNTVVSTADSLTNGPSGTLYGGTLHGVDMDTYCSLFSTVAWLPGGAAGWDVGRECGCHGFPCLCRCAAPTKAPTPAPTPKPTEPVQKKVVQEPEQEQDASGKKRLAAVCQGWCTSGKHAATSWKKKCGWGGCAPCAQCTPTKAPTLGTGKTADAGACYTWCTNHRHEGTPWAIKCGWSACSACDTCTPTKEPTPAPCLAFCSRHAETDWAKKCADWANCKGCAECSGGGQEEQAPAPAKKAPPQKSMK